MKAYPPRPLRVLKKYQFIGLPQDELAELEQKALDDIALPPRGGGLTRVELHCINVGVKSLTRVACLFRLSVKLSQDTERKHPVLEVLSSAAGDLNRITAKVTRPAAALKKKLVTRSAAKKRTAKKTAPKKGAAKPKKRTR